MWRAGLLRNCWLITAAFWIYTGGKKKSSEMPTEERDCELKGYAVFMEEMW